MTSKIEYVSIDTLIPYARNARTHSDVQVAQIAASITEFGWTNPILVDGAKGVIAGHGRLLAARKLRHDEVPVIELSHLTDTQKRAYIIADNKLSLNAGWDDEVLSVELEQLDGAGFDLTLTGFGDDDLSDLGLNVDETGMPILNDGDREPFQQKTFTLHDEQVSVIDDAVILAKTNPLVDTGINDNTNGNALALICKEWLEYGNR
jgi:ParB-like chromosome segregation protein Spo0J|tara:strand:- start:691 stop:1308 length:618 start_codon:yes stop_codon:yes gene_type:complete